MRDSERSETNETDSYLLKFFTERYPNAQEHPALRYIDDVLHGRQVCCKAVRNTVERHVRDLIRAETDPSFQFYFDEYAAQHRLDFNNWCVHSKGKWAGKPFVPEPWQAFVSWSVYGWMRKEDGCRRFSQVYIQVSRKNGKTTAGAIDGLYMTDGDGESGAECYSIATKRDQALLSHKEAVRMAKKSPDLSDRFKIRLNNLSVDETDSLFEPLGSNEDSMDGLNIHFALCDEVHAWRKPLLYEVVVTSCGARDQPIIMQITTPGYDRATICYENYEYSKRVIDTNSPINDDTWFAFIAEVEDGDDPFDESVWIKGNPNLDVSISRRYLRTQADRAKAQPSRLNAFRRLCLGQWTESEELWLSMEDWKKASSHVDENALRGKECYCGLDLARTKDMNAFVLVFPPDQTASGKFEFITRYWVPEESVLAQAEATSPYKSWVDRELIKATPGSVADYNVIQADIQKLAEIYRMIEVPYDPYNATQIVTNLLDAGINMVQFRQTYTMMSPACKEFERCMITGDLNPGDSPVLQWNAECCVIKQDPNGNIKIDRDASSRLGKVDGMVAAVMGLARAIVHEKPDKKPTPRARHT